MKRFLIAAGVGLSFAAVACDRDTPGEEMMEDAEEVMEEAPDVVPVPVPVPVDTMGLDTLGTDTLGTDTMADTLAERG